MAILGYEERFCDSCGAKTEGTVREDYYQTVVGWFCSQCGTGYEA